MRGLHLKDRNRIQSCYMRMQAAVIQEIVQPQSGLQCPYSRYLWPVKDLLTAALLHHNCFHLWTIMLNRKYKYLKIYAFSIPSLKVPSKSYTEISLIPCFPAFLKFYFEELYFFCEMQPSEEN